MTGLPVHLHTLEVEVDCFKRSIFEGFRGKKKEIFKVKNKGLCVFSGPKNADFLLIK